MTAPTPEQTTKFMTDCVRALVMVLPAATALLAFAGTFGYALGYYIDVKASQQVRLEVQAAVRPLIESDKSDRDRLARIETKIDILFADRTAK